MAEASSQTPATVSTPSSSAAGTVTGPGTGPQDSASHDHSVNGSQNGLDSTMDSSTKAPKDRNCPFCNQAFTSSSLGRHLDLYIKPKVSLPVLDACSSCPANPDGCRTPSRLMASTTSKRSRSCEEASRDASRETV
jgi:protein-disulfide isomerase